MTLHANYTASRLNRLYSSSTDVKNKIDELTEAITPGARQWAIQSLALQVIKLPKKYRCNDRSLIKQIIAIDVKAIPNNLGETRDLAQSVIDGKAEIKPNRFFGLKDLIRVLEKHKNDSADLSDPCSFIALTLKNSLYAG